MSALTSAEIANRIETLGNGWALNERGHLYKEFSFHNFLEPLAFANQIAPIAEDMQHHPDLIIRWGSMAIEIWTHDVDGITSKDFELAKKIEEL